MSEAENAENNVKLKEKSDNNTGFRYKAGIFLASVAGMSAVIGFGATVASVKKQDPKYFNKGLMPAAEFRESGAHLALRALGWGTLYAVTGCSVIFYSIWKLSGAQTLQEFRDKMGSILPKIPKNDPPRGRTEFSGMNDLLEYLSTLKSDK